MIRLKINNTSSESQEVVINPDRFLPSRQLIRQQLDAGKLGDVGLIRIHRWEPNVGHVYNVPGLIGQVANVPHDQGGLPTGLLRDLDLVLWLVGKLPDAIHAVEQSDAFGRFVQVHLGFPGGAMALIDFSNRLPNGDGYQSLSVIGSSGAAYADDHQNMQLVFRGGQAQAVRAEETGRRHAAAIQERIDSLQAGHDVAACVAEWQAVLKVAESARQAMQKVACALLPVPVVQKRDGRECPSYGKTFR